MYIVVYEKHAIQAKDHIESVNQERKKRGLKNIVVTTNYDNKFRRQNYINMILCSSAVYTDTTIHIDTIHYHNMS